MTDKEKLAKLRGLILVWLNVYLDKNRADILLAIIDGSEE